MSRLHDESKLAMAFVTLVRTHDTNTSDDNDDDSITLHIDTFAHKLARLKHLNQADMRQLHSLRASLHLRHSDELALIPTMTERPLGTPPPFAAAAIRTRHADSVPPWLRAVLLRLLPMLDVVSLARLGATCTALASATSHDKLWRRFALHRRAHDSISYRRLYCTIANFALRRERRRARALESLDALGAAPRADAVCAVAVCGMKRLQKRRVMQLMCGARADAVRAGDCALHYRPAGGAAGARLDVLDLGHLQLFAGERGQGASIVPVSAMIYVVDNFAPLFFSCKALVHLVYELARLRGGVRALLIYCVMWHTAPKIAVEADRVAQELFTPALVELRIEARVQAIDPRTGAGVAAGLEWLENALALNR